MKQITKIDLALEILPEKLKLLVLQLDKQEKEVITEIRLRRGRFFSAVLYGREYFICDKNRLMSECVSAYKISDADIDHSFRKAFKDSIHAYPRELSEGFITIQGGNRVGFCGSAVLDGGGKQMTSVKNISSINIRIAREIIGSGMQIYDKAFRNGICSLIIASPPCGGKTTVLRDICRMLSEKYRVCVIDERGELACIEDGHPQCDIGARTDVFDRYPKASAISAAVRVMSPDIIVCDEIGQASELEALRYAANSGIKLICTCHASEIDELRSRPAAGKLIKEKVFDSAAFLGTGSMCGKLISYVRLTK